MHYSLAIVLDQYGRVREDLYKTDTLMEMDEYLSGFNNHEEVRQEYMTLVSEFLLDHKDYIIKNEEKNNRVNNGRICLVYVGKKDILYTFPIMYKNSPKLLSPSKCFSKIKKELNDINKLKELYNYKGYLLSQYEKDLLKNYLLYPVSYKRYKNIFIESFVTRIKGLSESNLYLYLRSLMNLLNLTTNEKIDSYIDSEGKGKRR